ncbi:MAG: F0F1 ATP synthase subunit A [Dehalococcoidia bacterium]|nr:F0F1 ATP synthase subunit A [Dehalococcoidia bacterium]
MSAGGKRIVLVLAAGVVALFVFGFVVGAIGSAFFGGGEEGGFLPKPEVHLPPQPVLAHDAEEAEHGGLPGRFVLTNTLLSSWITTLVLIVLFFFATRNRDPGKAPRGLQNLMEAVIGATYDFVESVAGHENARRFFPLFATIFLFVLTNAWLGLLPIYPSLGFTENGRFFTSEPLARHLLRPAGTDLNMPMALALISFVFVEYWGLRTLGWHYFGKFFRFGTLLRARGPSGLFQGMIDIFVGMLELLSEFVRIVSFTFRLFGNMTAGEILLLVTAFLIPFVFSLPFYGLELLVGFIQALIFAGLTLVFVTIAVMPHEGHEAEEHG